MTVYISVVSHNHKAMIKKIGSIEKILKKSNIHVLLKNNTKENFDNIFTSNYTNLHIIDYPKGQGFAANNNILFKYAKNILKAKDEDYFLILNPDVDIKVEDIIKLVAQMKNDKCLLSTINLYKNTDLTVPDNSIRNFPGFSNFLFSFLGFKNKSCLDKSLIKNPQYIEWCSGAFMAFRVSYYEELEGFDEGYFMYCEDIDICYRSYLRNNLVKYYPDIKAIHFAQHNNKKIYSRHFVWHVKSMLRFLMKKRTLKSSLSYKMH